MIRPRIALMVAASCFWALAGCSPSAVPTVTSHGSGPGTTPPFSLQDGYYSIETDLTSRASDACYYSGYIQTARGKLLVPVDGPLADPGAGQASFESDMHWFASDSYQIRTYSDCGDWQVVIRRQTIFDEEVQAKIQDRPARVTPRFADPEYLRELPPPLATATPLPPTPEPPAGAVLVATATPPSVDVYQVVNTDPLPYLNVRTAPNTGAARIGTIPKASVVTPVGQPRAGWIEVMGQDFHGYVAIQYLKGPVRVAGPTLATLQRISGAAPPAR